MTKHTFYYSDKCPECAPFEAELKRQGLDYESVNITDSMSNLKRFLKLRDTHPIFEERRQWGVVGVPLLVTQDNKYIFELIDLNGSSCSITEFKK